ncbi:MAG: FKBP-type peptidyl-prolyl cis-trans isomerase [Candidatus Cryptobacteroides sp.]
MKTLKLLAMAAALVAAVACNSTTPAAEGEQAPVQAKSLLPSKAVTDSVSYLMGINFGSFLKGYGFGDRLNYSEIKKGMDDFVHSTGNQADTNFLKQFKISPEEMNRMFGEYLQQISAYTLAVNKEKEDKFLALNAKKDGVQTSESGLQYVISEEGNDVKPGPQDTVFVHYVGKLVNGSIFDQTTKAGPSARLTMNKVIPGWTEGLQLIGEGGKATLYIPSELGYGTRGQQGIEPNSTLIFDVTLDSVKRFVAPAPQE